MKIQNTFFLHFLFGCLLGLGASLVSKTVAFLFNKEPMNFEFSWPYLAIILFGGIALAIYKAKITS